MDAVDVGAGSSVGKKYTDEQIAIYLTSGATPKGSWDASTNTPTITQGSGTLGWYYDVIKAGTWDGKSFLVGDRIMFSANNKWERVATGVESDTPIVIEYIDENTTAFPTKRASGNALLNGDYVAVKSTATLPFTVGGLTFDSYADKAEWNGTAWQLKDFAVGKTNEIELHDTTAESISGTASFQDDVNIEVKTAFEELPEKTQTLKNKTIDCKTDGGKNTITNMPLSSIEAQADKYKGCAIMIDATTGKIVPKSNPPAITASVSPTSITEGTSTEITVTAVVVKGTEDITKVTFSDGTTTQEITTGVSSGGTFTKTFTISTTTTFTVKTIADSTVQDTALVYASTPAPSYTVYFGTTGTSVSAITDRSGKEYSASLTIADDKIVYKYPASLGALSSIKANGEDVKEAFTQTTEDIIGVSYKVYTQTNTMSGTFFMEFN